MAGRVLKDDSALGVRVRRGPDWKWGDQDEHNGKQQVETHLAQPDQPQPLTVSPDPQTCRRPAPRARTTTGGGFA